MDILTQAITGAVMAQSGANKPQIRRATVIGLFAGLLADADVLISSSQDPLLMLEYHRHFTHSVFFIPIGALIATLLLWPFMRGHLFFKQIYGFSLLGYLLSGFIDACTSYGTHLFWPLQSTAVAFNIISIVDPVFTLILLAALLTTLFKLNPVIARGGIALAGLYLLFGWYQMQSAASISQQLAQQRGHQAVHAVVKPTLGNVLLWRSIYQFEDRLYVDAIRVPPMGQSRVYTGTSVKLFDSAGVQQQLPPSSVLRDDLRRFVEFSAGYVAVLPAAPNFLVDIRYSMLPNSVQPLWGIEFDLNNPQQHADYRITRDTRAQTRNRFIDMLMGRDID